MECLLSLTVIRLPSLSPPCRLKSDPNTSGGFDDWTKREIRCVRRACRKIWERRGGELKILTRSEQAAWYLLPFVTLQHRLFSNRMLKDSWIHRLKFCPEPYLSPRREMKKLQQISCVPSLQAAANPVPGGRGGPSFTRLEGTPENLWPWLVTTPWDWRGANAAMAASPPVNDQLFPFSNLIRIHTAEHISKWHEQTHTGAICTTNARDART